MQFIAFLKLVFHRPWQPMRICLLTVASGANMQKVAAGRRDSVKGRKEGKLGDTDQNQSMIEGEKDECVYS